MHCLTSHWSCYLFGENKANKWKRNYIDVSFLFKSSLCNKIKVSPFVSCSFRYTGRLRIQTSSQKSMIEGVLANTFGHSFRCLRKNWKISDRDESRLIFFFKRYVFRNKCWKFMQEEPFPICLQKIPSIHLIGTIGKYEH